MFNAECLMLNDISFLEMLCCNVSTKNTQQINFPFNIKHPTFNIIYPFFFVFFISFQSISQKDTLPYEMYKDKLVLYTDFGYTSGPFSIKYNFPGPTEKLKFRNNYKDVIGLGVCYKWFSLRLSMALRGSEKSELEYGKTNYFSLGFNFTQKRFYWDVDISSFKGYAIKNAYHWNDTLNAQEPNDIRSNTGSFSFSINTWYFHDKGFKMSAVKGKTGHYLKEVKTWYLKTTFNIYGIGNNQQSIIPSELIDPANTKTTSPNFSASDIGLIPGYAYVNRINNWQFSGLFGLGAVLQSKYYQVNGNVRSFLGLAPRYDIRFIGGFSVPKYFVFLVTDFDNKSIRYGDLVYRQSFYSVKLVAGVRIHKKEKVEGKNKR